MIETALRNSQGDKSLRYVHPMESFTLEVALQAGGSLHRAIAAIEGRQFQDRPYPREFRDGIRSKAAVEFHILVRQRVGLDTNTAGRGGAAHVGTTVVAVE
jgi:hypothetical protein